MKAIKDYTDNAEILNYLFAFVFTTDNVYEMFSPFWK